jgi:hypothetical protein
MENLMGFAFLRFTAAALDFGKCKNPFFSKFMQGEWTTSWVVFFLRFSPAALEI